MRSPSKRLTGALWIVEPGRIRVHAKGTVPFSRLDPLSHWANVPPCRENWDSPRSTVTLKERCLRDGVAATDKELSRQFHLHLHRGIAYLASPNTVRSIGDLVRVAGQS